MIDGYWLQVRPEDYIKETSEGNCQLKIRPIDAPFNIMGMPAYIGYYVTHKWGNQAYMTWAPHSESKNQPLLPAQMPTKELQITYEQ